KGILPASMLRAMVGRVPAKMIPWDFVDLIETDPARRVRLKISLEGLAELHPAGIADIVEELAPADREAVFETLDEEVAAEALQPDCTIAETLERLRQFEGKIQNVSSIYLTDHNGKLTGVVPLARLLLLEQTVEPGKLNLERVVSTPEPANDRDVAELFEKY